MAAETLLAITLALLILPFSSSTKIFLACGSSSSVYHARDNPARNFTPDYKFLLSPSNSKTDSISSSSTSSLYSTARLFNFSSSYQFDLDPKAYYILRLHFFPFPSTSKASFNVAALNRYLLLSSFSPSSSSPSTPDIKEFLLWVDTSTFLLTFSPAPNNLAFINALELISSPPNLINGSQPYYITDSDRSLENNFFPQAMETIYRVNVGGPRITPENDTLWRTWEIDDGFLFRKNLSSENSSSGLIEYPTERGLTQEIAPDTVYNTARTLNLDPVTGMMNSNFNISWSFNVSPGFQYLVRMHFCNCWFNQQTFYFEVYLGGFTALSDLKPLKGVKIMVPFYVDFVIDAPGSGPLNVSIGSTSKSDPPNALLNGLEIMKLNNSHLSLAGDFGLTESGAESQGGKHLIAILIPSILGGLVLLLVPLFAFLLCLRRRRRRQLPKSVGVQKDTTHTSWSHYNAGAGAGNSVFNTSSKSSTEQAMNNSTSPRLKLGLQISFADVMFATSNFDEKLVVGAGGFGKVYKGVLRDGTKVAVKRCAQGSRQGYPEFQTEIVVLSRIRHRHLVALIGYCEEQSEMILVYEYMEKGTLKNYLYGSDLPCLSWKQRIEVCIAAARGLHYLHTGYSQSIIHRDVKSTNILLGENFVAKVSDFGLSRLGPSLGETHVSTGVKGTFGYLDPEYFKIQKLTEKSDVYSFGVVLFEVLCARPAIENYVNLAELALHWLKKGQLEKIVDKRLAGKINENSLRKFGETAAKCLADYGVDRPSIGDVLWNLEYALQLQVTQLKREPFEDSGIVDESQITVAASVKRVPSIGTDLEEVGEAELEAEAARRMPVESEMTTTMVFSQIVAGEGR